MSPDTPGKTLTRHGLLKGILTLAWAIPLALTIGKLFQFLRFELPNTQVFHFVLGTSADLPSLPAYIEDARIWLHRDAGGFYALDALCTHLGCTVHLQPDNGYQCGCHGSRFAPDGSVENGPAIDPLQFVALAWSSEGQLVADRSAEVDRTFRLNVYHD